MYFGVNKQSGYMGIRATSEEEEEEEEEAKAAR